MKWKVEITQIVDAPDTYTAEQVREAVARQFGTEVVRVEQVGDATVPADEDNITSTNDETNTTT